MSDFHPCPLTHFTPKELANILNAGFEEYLIPTRFDAATVARRVVAEAIDEEASQVYFRGGKAVGVILIARRGWNSRVSAMGVSPATRHSGLGRQMLAEAMDVARARGDRQMLLEVFAQNEKAVSLYQQMGFVTMRRLVGYRRAAGGGEAFALEEIDPLEFARIVAREGDPNLPWQLTAETLAATTAPAHAYSLAGHAFATITPPAPNAEDAFILRALIVLRDQRRQGWGRRMIAALAARHPTLACQIMPIVPSDLAPSFFRAAGFEEVPLHQWEMQHLFA